MLTSTSCSPVVIFTKVMSIKNSLALPAPYCKGFFFFLPPSLISRGKAGGGPDRVFMYTLYMGHLILSYGD